MITDFKSRFVFGSILLAIPFSSLLMGEPSSVIWVLALVAIFVILPDSYQELEPGKEYIEAYLYTQKIKPFETPDSDEQWMPAERVKEENAVLFKRRKNKALNRWRKSK